MNIFGFCPHLQEAAEAAAAEAAAAEAAAATEEAAASETAAEATTEATAEATVGFAWGLLYSNGKFSGTRVYHSILNVSELCCDQPHWPTSL